MIELKDTASPQNDEARSNGEVSGEKMDRKGEEHLQHSQPEANALEIAEDADISPNGQAEELSKPTRTLNAGSRETKSENKSESRLVEEEGTNTAINSEGEVNHELVNKEAHEEADHEEADHEEADHKEAENGHEEAATNIPTRSESAPQTRTVEGPALPLPGSVPEAPNVTSNTSIERGSMKGEISSKGSAAPHKEPELAQEEPELAQEEPELAQEEPESAQEEPESAQEEPESAQEEPESTQEELDSTQHEPEIKQEEPGLAQEKLDPTQEAPPVPEKKPAAKKKKPVRHVGFADEPEDLKEHHKYLEERRKEKMKGNPFWKIPPELSYLEKKEGPKPLPTLTRKKPIGKKSIDDLKDLPTRAVKEISAVNKDTVLNFYLHEIDIPVGPDRILVDVKYASLSSLDLEKLSKYKLNLSAVRVGLGYDYVGEIVGLGKKFQNHPDLKIGTTVFGVVHPTDKKGSLQTLLIINPRDVIIPITQQQMTLMEKVPVKLTFDKPNSFLVEDDCAESGENIPNGDDETVPPAVPPKDKYAAHLSDVAKFCTFSSMYCRAKQALSLMDPIFKRKKSANIIINGADTGLGYTIAQTIASNIYSNILESFNVILVVKDANEAKVRRFADSLNSGGSKLFHVIPFDLQNDDILLPGESVLVNYKKPLYFAAELLGLMFKAVPDSEPILKNNIDQVKIDLFVDIVGSKKMFQRNLEMQVLDDTHFPFKDRLTSETKILNLFGKLKEPLFTKILGPKSAGSTFVSYCDFSVRVPSYSVDKHISATQPIFNPWALKWSSGFANQFLGKYNYYTLFDLEVKESWVKELLALVLADELRMQIDDVIDWRDNFRLYTDTMRAQDGQTVFKIESF